MPPGILKRGKEKNTKMKFPDSLFEYIAISILIGVFIMLFLAETKFALRKRVQSRWRRIIINSSVAFFSLGILRVVFIPAMLWLAFQNEEWNFGINYLYKLPVWIEFIIAFILLDYTNYIWHILNHKIHFLWRFHHVHHSDLDLDITTGIRFHFGELIFSVFFRGTMVVLAGATPLLVIVYEIVFEAATNFHHSNLRLPFRFEKFLNRIMVTPRMHGIHHSIIENETDSNYSVIFSIWDRLHKTLRLNIHQNDIIIGIPSYQNPAELTTWNLLTMPFKKIRPWQFNDGSIPVRLIEKHALENDNAMLE